MLLEGHTDFIQKEIRRIFNEYKNSFSEMDQADFMIVARSALEIDSNIVATTRSAEIYRDKPILSQAMMKLANACDKDIINIDRAERIKEIMLMRKAIKNKIDKGMKRNDIWFDVLRTAFNVENIPKQPILINKNTYIKAIGRDNQLVQGYPRYVKTIQEINKRIVESDNLQTHFKGFQYSAESLRKQLVQEENIQREKQRGGN